MGVMLLSLWHAKSADPIVIRLQVSPNTHCTNEQLCLRFVSYKEVTMKFVLSKW